MRTQQGTKPTTPVTILGAMFALAACILLGACQPDDKARSMDRLTAMATAQQLHDELNRLEIAGSIDGQTRYYAEDVMRLDSNRVPSKGREAFLSYARAAHEAGYRPIAATTTVLDAWIEGGRMVEYGTTTLQVSFDGAAVVDDPVNYLAVWRIDPADPMAAQIETIIWNTQKPMEQLAHMAKKE